MAVVLNCWVNGVPKPQPRPRAFATRVNGKWTARMFTPLEEYIEGSKPRIRKPWDVGRWRAAIRAAVERAWSIYQPDSRNGHKGAGVLKDPVKGPVRCDLTFYFPRNEEMLENPFKFGREAFHYTHRPDRDNLEKAVLDTITEVGVWGDDCQVCEGEVSKWYCKVGGAPGVRIVIETLTAQEALLFAAEGEARK